MTHRHDPRDEMAGAIWHAMLAALYLGCLGFHLLSAWAHWRDSHGD